MPRNPYGFPDLNFGLETRKTRARNITHAQKVWCWENNPHKCNICGKKVDKFSDATFDHTRAHSKGGANNLSNVKITHRLCNSIKGKKSLSQTKKLLGIKSPKKKSAKKKARKKAAKPRNPFDIGFRFGP